MVVQRPMFHDGWMIDNVIHHGLCESVCVSYVSLLHGCVKMDSHKDRDWKYNRASESQR